MRNSRSLVVLGRERPDQGLDVGLEGRHSFGLRVSVLGDVVEGKRLRFCLEMEIGGLDHVGMVGVLAGGPGVEGKVLGLEKRILGESRPLFLSCLRLAGTEFHSLQI